MNPQSVQFSLFNPIAPLTLLHPHKVVGHHSAHTEDPAHSIPFPLSQIWILWEMSFMPN